MNETLLEMYDLERLVKLDMQFLRPCLGACLSRDVWARLERGMINAQTESLNHSLAVQYYKVLQCPCRSSSLFVLPALSLLIL